MLGEHTELVRSTAERLAERCCPRKTGRCFSLAAYWHDFGKLDERFQLFLHHGDVLAALSSAAPLAKSSQVPTSPTRGVLGGHAKSSITDTLWRRGRVFLLKGDLGCHARVIFSKTQA